jgi:hypothetical protein
MTTLDVLVRSVLEGEAARLAARLDAVDAHRAATAPRIRVERCVLDDGDGGPVYGPGWICIYGEGSGDWCPHPTWAGAMSCALDRARW